MSNISKEIGSHPSDMNQGRFLFIYCILCFDLRKKKQGRCRLKQCCTKRETEPQRSLRGPRSNLSLERSRPLPP